MIDLAAARDCFPRESVELIAIDITESGAPVTDFDVTLSSGYERPVDWEPASTIGDDIGYLLPGTLEPGSYVLWVRVVALPESVVMPVQRIRIT